MQYYADMMMAVVELKAVGITMKKKPLKHGTGGLKIAENELQKLIKGIFSRIKEKYGYTDEQALIYLQGLQDCAEDSQKSLEKRDKMLRDTVEELCEAKRLLKLAVENMNDGGCTRSCSTCKYGRNGCKYTEGYEWEHTEEAAKLLKED